MDRHRLFPFILTQSRPFLRPTSMPFLWPASKPGLIKRKTPLFLYYKPPQNLTSKELDRTKSVRGQNATACITAPSKTRGRLMIVKFRVKSTFSSILKFDYGRALQLSKPQPLDTSGEKEKHNAARDGRPMLMKGVFLDFSLI
jgi:hypothetical protein